MSSDSETELQTLLKYRGPPYASGSPTTQPWGSGKGADLTPQEVDENFYDVARRLDQLEENPVLPAEISSMNVSGNNLTITLTNGNSYGPFPLPTAQFDFRGTWQPGTEYAQYDFFSAAGGLYMVLLPLTSDSEFDPNAEQGPGQPYYKLIMPFQNLFNVGFFFPGEPGTGIGTGNAMFTFRTPRYIFLPTTFNFSQVGVLVAPTDDLICDIFRNDETDSIGYFTIMAGETVGSFTTTGEVQQFVPGDTIRVIRPSTIDETAVDLSMTFVFGMGIFSSSSESE